MIDPQIRRISGERARKRCSGNRKYTVSGLRSFPPSTAISRPQRSSSAVKSDAETERITVSVTIGSMSVVSVDQLDWK